MSRNKYDYKTATISAIDLHERLSRYYDLCDLNSSTAQAFTDVFDFLVHETWKRTHIERDKACVCNMLRKG